ncbi:DNA polymerase III subunit chi [Humitalea sp. 24SJ18S-53]|uniref:DNA polymerase III subunit chi n=1 Tax=Humitalea sp. 24SJ18S-53 TaxID=3422307 RepID=UPI003D66EA23
MTDIAFYHLTRSSLEQALPRLLGRVLDQGGRAVVLVGSPERLSALDQALWTVSDPDWLPHGTRDADLQPIWLTTDDAPAPNGARFLFLADGATSQRVAEYDRVFDLFDGQDELAVAAARSRWRQWKDAGHGLAYWQQGERGWEKKA